METKMYRRSSAPKKVVYTLNDYTIEGVYGMALTSDLSKTTALKITVNEFVPKYQSKNNLEEKVFNSFLLAYDGDFEKRNIKSEETEEPVSNVGVSLMMMSDPTNITGKLKESILMRESRGDARRFVTSFDADKPIEFVDLGFEESQEINNNLKMLGIKFFNEFNKIEIGSTFILTSEAYKTSKKYEKWCFDRAKDIDNPYLVIELHSRSNKALRLSCHYAALNHPNDFRILESDMDQATTTIEYCSKDYPKFISYESQTPDEVDKIFAYLKDKLGEEFKKGDFIRIYKQFAKRREQFRKEFENIMDMVKEVANLDGYYLSIRPNTSNNGKCYTLTKLENKPLSNGVKPANELMNEVEQSKLSNSQDGLNVNDNNDFTNNTNNTDNYAIF